MGDYLPADSIIKMGITEHLPPETDDSHQAMPAHTLIGTHNTAWILGLPIDIVGFSESLELLEQSIHSGTPLTFATPNSNFLSIAAEDHSFRDAIFRCDLSLADGMPLVWIAKVLGVPIHKRVAGSTLFEKFIAKEREEPIRLFFFGGADGAGESACTRINQNEKYAICAGWIYPDFGDIESMAKPAFIDRLNSSDADFLVVALGARKGHLWMDKVRTSLNIPVVSHLGAVINFAAGTLDRAPLFMQRAGLEWAWRIREEPSLWIRYFRDALHLLKCGIFSVLPILLYSVSHRFGRPKLQLSMNEGNDTLFMHGSLDSKTANEPARIIGDSSQILAIDIGGITSIDPIGLGFIFAVKFRKRFGRSIRVIGTPKCLHLIRWHRAECLFE